MPATLNPSSKSNPRNRQDSAGNSDQCPTQERRRGLTAHAGAAKRTPRRCLRSSMK